MDREDKTKYLRSMLVFVEVLAPIMRQYLDNSYVSIELLKEKMLQYNSIKRTLHSDQLEAVKSLNNRRKDPFKHFDVSLMFITVRRFFQHFYVFKERPLNGWTDNDQTIDDKTTVGDVLRIIKRKRDQLYHNASGNLTARDYNKFLKACQKIATKADNNGTESSFRNRLENCVSCCLDTDMTKIHNDLKELTEKCDGIKVFIDKNLKECIKKINNQCRSQESSNINCQLILQEVSNAKKAVKTLQSKIGVLQKEVRRIRVNQVSRGSIIFKVTIENSLIQDDSVLCKEIEKFVQAVTRHVDLRFTSDEERYVVITADEDSHNFNYEIVENGFRRIDDDNVLYLTVEDEEIDIDKCLSNNVDLIQDVASTTTVKRPGQEQFVMVVIGSSGNQHKRASQSDTPEKNTISLKLNLGPIAEYDESTDSSRIETQGGEAKYKGGNRKRKSVSQNEEQGKVSTKRRKTNVNMDKVDLKDKKGSRQLRAGKPAEKIGVNMDKDDLKDKKGSRQLTAGKPPEQIVVNMDKDDLKDKKGSRQLRARKPAEKIVVNMDKDDLKDKKGSRQLTAGKLTEKIVNGMKLDGTDTYEEPNNSTINLLRQDLFNGIENCH